MAPPVTLLVSVYLKSAKHAVDVESTSKTAMMLAATRFIHPPSKEFKIR
jgi:hypothetical protein